VPSRVVRAVLFDLDGVLVESREATSGCGLLVGSGERHR
jgi:phosphoglycolate phosphatase-like HAD superfamily hydrolase